VGTTPACVVLITTTEALVAVCGKEYVVPRSAVRTFAQAAIIPPSTPDSRTDHTGARTKTSTHHFRTSESDCGLKLSYWGGPESHWTTSVPVSWDWSWSVSRFDRPFDLKFAPI